MKLKCTLVNRPFDDTQLVQERLTHNPLVSAIGGVIGRIAGFKERVKAFYFEVILFRYKCPECAGRLIMTGQSQCSCSCGNTFDPTLVFQKSTCCGARLVRKTFHYVCSNCNKTIPSRFLFDEQVFDKDYFREMMRDSRIRARKKREEIRRLLAESRSGALPLLEEPCLESVDGLIQDLNNFVQTGPDDMFQAAFDIKSEFNMDHYRDHILSVLTWDNMPFSDITPLIDDCRKDRVWRFITLVFMQNDREVDVTQYGTGLMVQRVYNEAHS